MHFESDASSTRARSAYADEDERAEEEGAFVQTGEVVH
jgi:hypothetical protein